MNKKIFLLVGMLLLLINLSFISSLNFNVRNISKSDMSYFFVCLAGGNNKNEKRLSNNMDLSL